MIASAGRDESTHPKPMVSCALKVLNLLLQATMWYTDLSVLFWFVWGFLGASLPQSLPQFLLKAVLRSWSQLHTLNDSPSFQSALVLRAECRRRSWSTA